MKNVMMGTQLMEMAVNQTAQVLNQAGFAKEDLPQLLMSAPSVPQDGTKILQQTLKTE